MAVAVSGGRDSTALLHATVRAARAVAAEVHALHVHHGLNPQADAWSAQVRCQCRRWGAVFHSRRIQARPQRGHSIEAWARRERYLSLHAMAIETGCGLLLLAHHRRDQAETWLLQALRGGGAAGLAAMPEQAERSGVVWARPWLDQPREAVDAYVRRHRLRPVEDPSNSDLRFARNRLRMQVWPVLVNAFPDIETVLSAAARQAAHAAALAAECARQDLPQLRVGSHLRVPAWLALPPARRRNALLHWLSENLAGGVPGTLVDRLLMELPVAAVARWPTSAGELRLYRGQLGFAAAPIVAATVTTVAASPHCVDLSRRLETPLATWRGRFRLTDVPQGGAPLALLQQLEPRLRSGGERFRLAPLGLARSLKRQYQARGVPPWERDGPLLYAPDGRLVFAPGLGVEAGVWADPGEPQRDLCWVPDSLLGESLPR